MMASSVLLPRVILITIVSTGLFFPNLWQPLLDRLWSALYHSSFYQASYFETVLTVLSYGIIEPIYTARFGHNHDRRIDIRRGVSDESEKSDRPPLPKMKRPQHRLPEMIVYVAPLLLMDLTMVKKFAGVDVSTIRRSAGYSPTQRHVHATFLAPSLHRFTWDSPLQLVRALPVEAPTSRRLITELTVALFLYDAFFFAIHLAFHKVPVLHSFHGPHHGHQEIHPQVTNRLSVVERLSLVLLANFALNIIGSHVLTRSLFVPMFVYLLIEIHSGVDLDWQYDKILPHGWGAGTRKHAIHHREGRRYYEPFFCWWDEALALWEGVPTTST